MSNSAILKSSLAKKYWMAATGLFLCLFLVGHLAGNLQLLIPGYAGRLKFNEYAIFMVSNPFVIILSWLTYISIIFHAIDGILMTIQNHNARSQKYVMNKPQKNTRWSSRNMAFLGTILLVFIVVHMSQFWYQVHYGELPYMKSQDGSGYVIKTGGLTMQNPTIVKNGTLKNGIIYNANNEKVGEAMEDLYESVNTAFQQLWIVIFYSLAMFALAFHLSHGFQSAFQSLGINHRKYTPFIKKFGTGFCIIVPLLFGIIPIISYFIH